MTKMVTSKIKTMFPGDLLRYVCAICDSERLISNNQRMRVLTSLLYTHGVQFEILGGATNRIVLQIDGYAVKIALDEQGYDDNLIEYALSHELQPFVTKSYETNGYIQIQQCVSIMTKELFQLHKVGIYKILDMLAQDYLLGDVGYLPKNMANWGIIDNKPVILDYAYIHRATENLFTCDVCGSALRYDSSYDKLMCNDRSACKAVYTYNERKNIQGDQVDIDMVNEVKKYSIKLSKGEITKEIEEFEDRLVGDNYFIIDTPGDMREYRKKKEEIEMRYEEDMWDDIDLRRSALIDLMRDPTNEEARKILNGGNRPKYEEVPEPILTENYLENYADDRRYLPNTVLPVFDEYDENGNLIEDDTGDDVDWVALRNETLSKFIDKAYALKNGESPKLQNETLREQLSGVVVDEESNEEIQEPIILVEESKIDEVEQEEPVVENVVIDEVEQEEPVVENVIIGEVKPEPVEKTPETINEPSSAEEDILYGVIEDSSNRPQMEDPQILINGKPLAINEEVVL